METTLQINRQPMRFGIISMFLWIIPIIGLGVSVTGIMYSVEALKSAKLKIYKLALSLNIVGLILQIALVVVYIITMINEASKMGI